MTETPQLRPDPSKRLRTAAAFGVIFGILTLLSGGSVIFGSEAARASAGNYLPFVVWFNFLSGALYVVAGIAILLKRRWAFGLSAFIAASTRVVTLAFLVTVWLGTAFEMRTVGALMVRTGFWAAIAFVLNRKS